MLCENLSVGNNGVLQFAGQDVSKLVKEYGTPLFLMDEERIRANCRRISEPLKAFFPKGSMALYAGKAASFSALYPIVESEGLGIDVVSCGEIYTAKRAGFPMEKSFFHGNNKTDEDIRFAMDAGVGFFVVDSEEELQAVSVEAVRRRIKQKILLRITPGIDPHTYAAVSTGKVDSKFGNAIVTGAAAHMVELALSLSGIDLCGYHCHVGSQVFAEDVFERAVAVMLAFSADMKKQFGFEAGMLDLGGGFGVRYTEEDPTIDIPGKIASIATAFTDNCEKLGLKKPTFFMEPGRSIVADAGMTLYTVGTVKRIPGFKNYVSVDGGMTDNPRYALYRSKYTVLAAEKMNEAYSMRASVAGRCCESGDLIGEDILLPETMTRGDLLAVCTTGAYNYSMSSNYNRIPRPAVVMLNRGTSRVAVKRETYDDIVSLDQ